MLRDVYSTIRMNRNEIVGRSKKAKKKLKENKGEESEETSKLYQFLFPRLVPLVLAHKVRANPVPRSRSVCVSVFMCLCVCVYQSVLVCYDTVDCSIPPAV